MLKHVIENHNIVGSRTETSVLIKRSNASAEVNRMHRWATNLIWSGHVYLGIGLKDHDDEMYKLNQKLIKFFDGTYFPHLNDFVLSNPRFI